MYVNVNVNVNVIVQVHFCSRTASSRYVGHVQGLDQLPMAFRNDTSRACASEHFGRSRLSDS